MSYNINSGNNNNIDLLLSCFSKYVFSQAKESIRDLKYYFSTNPATSGNPLVSGLLDAIETYDLDAIGLPLFNSILAKSQVSPAEYQSILDRVVEFKKYTKEQMLPIKKYLSDVIASTWIDKASQQYRDNPTEFINYIKNVNLKSSDDVRLSSINFNDLDINSILAQENENIVMRALESFILPYSAKEYKSSNIDKEIKKVYNDVGNTDVIPGFPQSYVKYDKEPRFLSSRFIG